jgi:hypothetical protein
MNCDYFGNDIKAGDKVIIILGKHFRKSIIESVDSRAGQVKIKDIKYPVSQSRVLRFEW